VPHALAVRQEDTFEDGALSTSREDVLTRYRRLREISKRLHHDVMKLISGDALMQQARRLGLAQGRTLILDDMDEMSYVFDLAIHTAHPGRSRAIDRYARSSRFAAGSDEALVLEAMRTARFAVLVIDRRHETAGLVATDLLRGTKVWLVDIGLESSLPDEAVLATRLYTPEGFSMTAGVNVPIDLGLLADIHHQLPRHLGEEEMSTLIDDRRFAEAIYRVALADGIMDRVMYRDPA
jgi:hypothetical protein